MTGRTPDTGDLAERLAEEERVFFELSPVAMYVIDGASIRATAVNRAALALYGYDREEFLRLPLDRLGGVDGGSMKARLRTSTAGGKDATGRARHRRKDGTLVDVEWVARTTTFRGRPSLLAIVVDVTDKLRVEESQARLAAIVDSSSDAILSMTPDGIIESWNRGAERLFGYAAAEIVGRSVAILLPPELAHERAEVGDRLRRGDGVADYETVRLAKDGRRIDVSAAMSPILDAEGRVVGVSTVARDITDRKRIEEQRRRIAALDAENHRIQAAGHLKDQFTSNMSHELRTPLNSVIGFASLMHAGKVGPISEQQKEYLGDILASSRHLLELLSDILDLVRVESGHMAFTPEPGEPGRVIADVLHALEGTAAAKNLSVSVEVDPALTEVVMDQRALRQILYNYISNGIKFTGARGAVAVRVSPDGPAFFLIEVADTGIGVSPGDIPRLFVEFQQLDSGAAKRYQGTGLGLALTKRIVEALGGTVSVASIVGRGSRFFARLPRGSTGRD